MKQLSHSSRYIEHDPGGPPHRPQVGADDVDGVLALAVDATAKTLSDLAVLVDPHSGHLAFTSALIVRWSCSNFAWQDLQVYS